MRHLLVSRYALSSTATLSLCLRYEVTTLGMPCFTLDLCRIQSICHTIDASVFCLVASDIQHRISSGNSRCLLYLILVQCLPPVAAATTTTTSFHPAASRYTYYWAYTFSARSTMEHVQGIPSLLSWCIFRIRIPNANTFPPGRMSGRPSLYWKVSSDMAFHLISSRFPAPPNANQEPHGKFSQTANALPRSGVLLP